MWEAFQRFKALDSRAQKIFGRAVILFPLVALSLRFRGFNQTRASLQTGLPRESQDANPRESVPTICRMVKAAGHYGLVHPNCLEESLVLWHFLRREKITPVLRIGVRKLHGKFEAHAWVECRGRPLNDREDVGLRFRPFHRAIAPG